MNESHYLRLLQSAALLVECAEQMQAELRELRTAQQLLDENDVSDERGDVVRLHEDIWRKALGALLDLSTFDQAHLERPDVQRGYSITAGDFHRAERLYTLGATERRKK